MTPRLARALARLKKRGYATADGDFVFVTELQPDRPVRDKPLREAFKLAREAAGLKPIKQYNLRHSFGTSLAAKGVNVRTIQALMRHARLTTTEQYMAYAPRPELANQIARALDPHSLPENVTPIRARPAARRFSHAWRRRYRPSGCVRSNASWRRATSRRCLLLDRSVRMRQPSYGDISRRSVPPRADLSAPAAHA